MKKQLILFLQPTLLFSITKSDGIENIYALDENSEGYF